jgi:DNA-directed RNA polymerase specialized sigma24 family protein
VLSASGEFEEQLDCVYGAALCAAAHQEAAEEATRSAFIHAAPDEPLGALMARAVRQALAVSPAEPLSQLPPSEREAIGLARIARLSVGEIAELVGCDAVDVKRRMRSGMARLTDSVRLPVAG